MESYSLHTEPLHVTGASLGHLRRKHYVTLILENNFKVLKQRYYKIKDDLINGDTVKLLEEENEFLRGK